jgi:hypothetical protein
MTTHYGEQVGTNDRLDGLMEESRKTTRLTFIILSVAILTLVLSLASFFAAEKPDKESQPLGSVQSPKCFSYAVYSTAVGAWRWRAEHLNEYFPTRDDAVANCVAMLGPI